MADVFERHPLLDKERDRLWDLIPQTPTLDWMLLTKRPENVADMVPPQWMRHWPRGVWLGVTAENQEWLGRRWTVLRDLPAPVKFLSCEPLLGPIFLPRDKRLSWVIVGGESGPGARPMEESWARSLLREAELNGIPAFMKQLGDGLAKSKLTKDARKKDRKGELLSSLPPTMQVRQWPSS